PGKNYEYPLPERLFHIPEDIPSPGCSCTVRQRSAHRSALQPLSISEWSHNSSTGWYNLSHLYPDENFLLNNQLQILPSHIPALKILLFPYCCVLAENRRKFCIFHVQRKNRIATHSR